MSNKKRIMNTPILIIIIPIDAGTLCFSKSNIIITFGLKQFKYKYSFKLSVLLALYIIYPVPKACEIIVDIAIIHSHSWNNSITKNKQWI